MPTSVSPAAIPLIALPASVAGAALSKRTRVVPSAESATAGMPAKLFWIAKPPVGVTPSRKVPTSVAAPPSRSTP